MYLALCVDTDGNVSLVRAHKLSGKTTLFKAISGTVQPASGRIAFEGRDLRAIPGTASRVNRLQVGL